MKKRTSILLLASLAALAMPLTSCGDVASSSSVSSSEAAMRLSEDTHDLLFGETFALTVLGEGKGKVTWTSSDEGIASVDEEGNVTGNSRGNATITATRGGNSASCVVTVVFGDIVPSLSIQGVVGNSLSLVKDSEFAISGIATFAGKSYECGLEATSDNAEVATYENGKIKAKSKGDATLTFKGQWQGFDVPSMTRQIQIHVSDDVSIAVGYMKNGQREVTNRLSLSLLSSWQGTDYLHEVTLFGEAYEGESKIPDVSFVNSDNSIAKLTGNVISGKKSGICTVFAQFTTSKGDVYQMGIEVEVSCPIATYDENIRLCVNDPFPVETNFGEGASVLAARQGERELEVRRGRVIKGIAASGADNEPLVVETTAGGFVFTDLFTYSATLTKDNIFSVLSLSSGKIIEGYYILEEDIDEPVDFTKQISSSYAKGSTMNTYFAGTLDGQGHTIKALVGESGMFGGFGDGAFLTRTHFDFTFASTSGYAVGLAKNTATFIQNNWTVTIRNNYFTTTNYLSNSFTMMDYRFNHLVLRDNLVELSGTENLDPYTNARQEQAALFRVDATVFQGPSTSYAGEFRNNHVITGRFMPMSDGIWLTDSAGLDQVWVSYAKNDTDKLGDFQRSSTDSAQYSNSVLSPFGTDQKPELFGHLGDSWYGSDELAVLYSARGDIADGGIYRYDSKTALKVSGIEKVGDWAV